MTGQLSSSCFALIESSSDPGRPLALLDLAVSPTRQNQIIFLQTKKISECTLPEGPLGGETSSSSSLTPKWPSSHKFLSVGLSSFTVFIRVGNSDGSQSVSQSATSTVLASLSLSPPSLTHSLKPRRRRCLSFVWSFL